MYKKLVGYVPNSNSVGNKNYRKEVALRLLWCYCIRVKIIFLDETGISFNISPRYGYSIKGQDAIMVSDPESDNYSLLMAMN